MINMTPQFYSGIVSHPSGILTQTSGYVDVVTRFDHVAKSVCPDYAARLGRQCVTNPYMRSVGTDLVVPINIGGTEPVDAYGYYRSASINTFLDFNEIVSGAILTEVELRTEQDVTLALRGAYNDEVRQFQGGAFLGELRETIASLRNPAKALRKGLKDWIDPAYKLRRLPRSKRGDALASSWLEWQMGVAPLIGDVEAAGDALYGLVNRPRVTRLGRSASNAESRYVGTVSPYRVISVEGLTAPIVYEVRVETTVDARYIGDFNVGTATSLPYQWGLSPWDVVPTAWELIPWSFLVDYFSNIGDVLGAMSSQSVNNVWRSLTTIQTDSYVAILKTTPQNAQGVPSRVQGPTVKTMKRRLGDFNVDLTNLRLDVPAFDKDANKWLNIAALLKASQNPWL